MSLKCKIGVHQFQGCKCSACGKTRDNEHNFIGCQCSVCGRIRDSGHTWEYGTCTQCGTQRSPNTHVLELRQRSPGSDEETTAQQSCPGCGCQQLTYVGAAAETARKKIRARCVACGDHIEIIAMH
jgi:hypothetical protein